jgi:hypothetical protein
MYKRLQQSVFIIALLLLAACTATPVPDMYISHFNQTSQSEAHSKCMNDNAMFNNRQLMVAPRAVESAWGYCLNQFGIFAPGQTEDETISDPWADEEE